MSDIPDDWIPLGDIEASSDNKDGGVFLYPQSSGIRIIHYREGTQNDVVNLFDCEVPDLIHRLVDYQNGEL